MKVYLCILKDDNSIEITELEMRETPKAYRHIGGGFLIKKENLNRAIPHGSSDLARRCFLTENNPDKAMEILIKQDKLYTEWMINKYKELIQKRYSEFK